MPFQLLNDRKLLWNDALSLIRCRASLRPQRQHQYIVISH